MKESIAIKFGSQIKFARAIKVAENTVNAWCTATRTPQPEYWGDIKSKLGVDVYKVLYGV